VAYTHSTWGTVKTALAARLHDSSKLFYLDAELDLYLAEALRTFSALSAFWRERITFNTVANTIFYDLPTQAASQLGYTLTDRNLISIMEYHLLEPANNWGASTAWGGTAQFVMADLEDALERRRNQFLADTGMVLTHSTIASAPPPAGRVALTDTMIDVRRACWKDASDVYHYLWREDEFALNAYSRTWALDATTPYAYSVMGPPPVQLQLAAVPLDAGTLDLISVNTGAALDVTSGVVLGIPDDWTWVVKWGALADILGKDGPAFDPIRASYCEKQYRSGVELAREQGCIIQAQLQGVNLWVDSIYATDCMYATWQNEPAASTTDIAVCGYNLVATRPQPAGVYSLTFDIVRKAPVPALDGTQLQVGREQLDILLDYAEHLALFKVGGAEFQATFRQAENFLQQAATYNSRLSASARNAVASIKFSKREAEERPRTHDSKALGTMKGAA
jgi:hypothetical protein